MKPGHLTGFCYIWQKVVVLGISSLCGCGLFITSELHNIGHWNSRVENVSSLINSVADFFVFSKLIAIRNSDSHFNYFSVSRFFRFVIHFFVHPLVPLGPQVYRRL